MPPIQPANSDKKDHITSYKKNTEKPISKRKQTQRGGHPPRTTIITRSSANTTSSASCSDKNVRTDSSDKNISNLTHNTDKVETMTGNQQPKNPRKGYSTQPNDNTIKTHNSFEVLTNLVDSEDDMETTEEQQEPSSKKEKPPPPIVIHGQPKKHKEIIQLLKSLIKGEFTIKYTIENINITAYNRHDRLKLMSYLDSKQTPYHTYTDTNDKTHAFVIRGLAEDVTTDEIEKELKEKHNIAVKKCYKMSNINRPLYLLITDNTITLKHLDAHVRHIVHTKVNFERRRNTRKITQCHRCQKWGHATSNCKCPIKCMYCAANHWSKDCTNKEKKPKCSNCTAAHKSNSVECSVYTKRIDWLNKSKEKQNTQTQNNKFGTNYNLNNTQFPELQYKAAPPPKTNPWSGKRVNTETAGPQSHLQPTQQKQQPPQLQHQQQTRQSNCPDPQLRGTAINNGNPPMTFQQPIDSYKELMHEFAILHTLVNIDGILNAIKDLNALLTQCNSPEEKFSIFTKFTSNLANYDI